MSAPVPEVPAPDLVVEVGIGDRSMPAPLWLPPSGEGPGLLLLQEIFGVSAYIRARAADLAALGYVVCAPELYWRLESQTVDESGDDVLEQAMGLAGRLDWETTVADAVAALGVLRERPEVRGRTGVIGFCFGGGVAFNVAAVADPDALVSYYGSALGQLLGLADRVEAPSLHHFGLDDAYVDLATQAQIEGAVLRRPGNRFETYAGAGHAFDNPHPMFHHPAASLAAWATTVEFLDATLVS